MSTSILELEDVSIGFGADVDVIRHVNLTVGAGEFVSVIGPSGCGKSTILNAVAGLLKTRAGTVKYEGKDLRGLNTDVGYMTQGDTLLPWQSVYQNVALPLRLRKVPRAEIRSRVTASLEQLGLADAGSKFPSELSGGMKRRALLARSTIYAPPLLLMDEPYAALDAQLRTQMHRQLRETVHRTGQSVLFITHDLSEAVFLSDRIIVLGGKPASPIAEFAISFPDPRDPDKLRFDREFVAIEAQVHEALNRARGEQTEGGE